MGARWGRAGQGRGKGCRAVGNAHRLGIEQGQQGDWVESGRVRGEGRGGDVENGQVQRG